MRLGFGSGTVKRFREKIKVEKLTISVKLLPPVAASPPTMRFHLKMRNRRSKPRGYLDLDSTLGSLLPIDSA
ncbi:MAG: hypothetical protein C5B49_11890 [Bdellovibrio sp.]|nr:MAG: hypothetical protein C5B49_11890 [Bdellovibrio sp.]